jgi:nucleoside-diphosphate-sugar epimerase
VLSPVWVDDLVDGVLQAAAHPQAAGRVLTLTAGTGMSVGEYFGRVAAAAGGRVRMVPGRVAVPLVRAAGALERGVGRRTELSPASVRMLQRPGTYSIAAATALLGYRPRLTPDEAVARVEAWLRSGGMA